MKSFLVPVVLATIAGLAAVVGYFAKKALDDLAKLKEANLDLRLNVLEANLKSLEGKVTDVQQDTLTDKTELTARILGIAEPVFMLTGTLSDLETLKGTLTEAASNTAKSTE